MSELQHAVRDVEADRPRAAGGDGERDVAGARSEIQRALAPADISERDQLRLPARILSVRQDRRDQIVTIRDRRK